MYRSKGYSQVLKHTKLAVPRVAIRIKPNTRTVHLNLRWYERMRTVSPPVRTNPINGINFCAAAGNTVLPDEDPIEVIPKANPRLLGENQCDTTASAGQSMNPQLTPKTRPYVRKNCQYCVHSVITNMHATRMRLVAKHGILKYPRSDSFPVASARNHTSAY